MAKKFHPKRIRVLVVDDHALVREGLRMLIESAEGMVVVGEAADARTALELTARLRPEVVILDIALPDAPGVQVTQRLKAQCPETQVVALSAYNDDFVQGIVRAGAAGYLTRNFAPSELLKAIQEVCEGRFYFSPGISRKVGAPNDEGGEDSNGLTARETQVLELICNGFTNKEIALELGIGCRTVETHREGIMRKLRLNNVASLTRYAVAQGLVSLT